MAERNTRRIVRLARRLGRSSIMVYLVSFGAMLLLAGLIMAATGCGYGILSWNASGVTLNFAGLSCFTTCMQLGEQESPLPYEAVMTAEGTHAVVFFEFDITGTFTPAEELALQGGDYEMPPILDELAEKSFLAIRVPHAPPTYPVSSLIPGLTDVNTETIIFNYYSPPSTTTVTSVPVSVTRRTEYEPQVNQRYPIQDGKSHWEVWWLPEGDGFPNPGGPFRLDGDAFPEPVQARFRIDYGGAEALACAGCPLEILFFNGYVYLGPHKAAVRYLFTPEPSPPFITFGPHCGGDLAPTVATIMSPTVPYTFTYCLENWDPVTRTYSIDAVSYRSWDYDLHTQEDEPDSLPVPVDSLPFTVTIGALHGGASPGTMGVVAVHTPTFTISDTRREQLVLMARSVVSPEVEASGFSLAVPVWYQLDEKGPESGYVVYLPLVLREK